MIEKQVGRPAINRKYDAIVMVNLLSAERGRYELIVGHGKCDF